MISIVIPTCNRNALLSKCLDCLAPSAQNYDAHAYEVIVTDDSIDNRAKKLISEKYPWAKWIEGPKRGPAANRNNGAKHASKQWLLFVDDDCLPSQELLNQYIISINSNKGILVFEGSTFADRPPRSFNEESPINETGGYLWSCNFMIDRQFFFQSLHGFDEKFPYAAMEDVDLDYRIKKTGKTILFVKSALVIHPWREQNNMFSVTCKRFKSLLYFLEKHPEKRESINSLYFLRVFYKAFIKDTLPNLIKYQFRGLREKLVFAFMQLYFAGYLLFKK